MAGMSRQSIDISGRYQQQQKQQQLERKVAMEEDALIPVTLRELYCRYTVSCSLPFAHVEQQAFRDLIRYIRPAADDLLPSSDHLNSQNARRSLHPLTLAAANGRTEAVRKLLQDGNVLVNGLRGTDRGKPLFKACQEKAVVMKAAIEAEHQLVFRAHRT
ncbi:hypothetical protein ARSEF1564_008271 [Beauveria bassiana]